MSGKGLEKVILWAIVFGKLDFGVNREHCSVWRMRFGDYFVDCSGEKNSFWSFLRTAVNCNDTIGHHRKFLGTLGIFLDENSTFFDEF